MVTPAMDATSGEPDTGISAPPDAGSPVDPDAGSPVDPDAGSESELPPMPIDAGQVMDAGEMMLDAGPPRDAGDEPLDSGTVVIDAGKDSGVMTRSCAKGRELGGYCWFLGAKGQSCNMVCAARGGYEPSLDYIGSLMQGGSLERCDAVLTLLTAPGTTTSGFRTDGRGVGCHLYEDVRWWLDRPDFSPTASQIKSRLACSCVDAQ